MYNNIKIQLLDQTALLEIDRPKYLNALNRETLEEIEHAFQHELLSNTDIRGVIITGAGEKAFVAGADIKEFMKYSTEEGMALAKWGHGVMNRIYTFPKPVIAAINGYALGGGLELALACHMRVASNSAKMGLPEVSLGLIPGYGGTQRLTQLVGRGKALEMILSGEMIDAEDANQWGLVNYTTNSDELISKTTDLLKKMYGKSAHAIAAAIKAVNAGLGKDTDGYEEEIRSFGESFGTPDFHEGVDAFLTKRKPNF
ncbi:enoyl-CoA hydratase-related protein [Sphingobacterium sp. lm-10]|uniref:enoyl-CoA hydratase/isomerase family protein n=1 Tax=Sphingobacterium sp. lm-10 TaxID=2944904 RepID=UPI00201FE55A|nr:enoyl-CoA hydratase-related protein [Sphingobacterium sp. lm-10]MCL7988331.1 enoyl-CoA hydratase-related protein [Sphingobacterium sp. lm-10]